MFCSQLFTLEKSFPSTQLEKIDEYLSSLSSTALSLITAYKISIATGIDYGECIRFLKECVDLGLMHKRYALCCPTCGGFLRISDKIDDLIDSDGLYCHRCDETVQIDETDFASNVEVLFAFEGSTCPFDNGQQLSDISPINDGSAVARTCNLNHALKVRIIEYSDLFAPTEEEYGVLSTLLKDVKTRQNTTTATGTTLESFCFYLFGLCKIFKATLEFRNETNQIDTFVRITSYLPDGLFGIKSNYFAIECKNEQCPPKGTYLSKLHSILHIIDSNLGIIVSRKTAPSTFKVLAHDIFLRDGMCFIWFDIDELEKIVSSRVNLLELMDEKVSSLRTDSRKHLSEYGVY